VAGVLALTIAAAAGCEDLPLCAREVFVAFEQTTIAADVNASAPGVQTDVHVQTSLQDGDVIVLDVFLADGSLLEQVSTTVIDGAATFPGISVAAPRVVLRATGHGTCGEGRDEVTVDVVAGAPCALRLAPEPEHNPHYAPLDVLSTRSDPDPLSTGYQATVVVDTLPGWSAEIFRTTTEERSLGVANAGSDGIARMPVTVLDGRVAFRAACRGAGTEVASQMTTVIADTTPPSCELTLPIAGATITPALDQDHDLSNGVQLAVSGRADGGDVDGEPAVLTVTGPDGAPVRVPASDTDQSGGTTAMATLEPAGTPATYELALTMRDHAGNSCMAVASYDVVLDGCAIAVTAPSAPVTRDADGSAGNGSQVDVALAVAPSCAGQTVTGQCGAAQASAAVALDGGASLRLDVCATSPCEIDASCTFAVTSAVGIETEASATIAFDDIAPASVGELSAAAIDRQRVRLRWIAPADKGSAAASYVLKSSPVPLTDATFDSTGTTLPTGVPRAPGSAESLDVPSRTGAPRFFAIAARDRAGNRSLIATAGPVVPVFDQTGAIAPPASAQGAVALGSAIAHGKFNDDEFDDVAIAAPGQNVGAQARTGAVYVYFGGPNGLAATPGLMLTIGERDAALGSGLAAVRWSSATRDDLAIGAPGASGGDGRVFVVRGGAGFGTGARAVATAELAIGVSAARPGWFAGGALGSVLAAADVDGDGKLDLVASAPRGGRSGGAVIIYGGTAAGDVALSDQDASGANGAIVELFADPATRRGRRLGFYLHAVGPTLGALDRTDDLVIAYADDYTTAGDSLYVLRGDGTRPAVAGVSGRAFVPGRDVRLDFATSSRITEWGSQVTSIDDQNGDGARDLVIGAYRAQSDRGQVLIVSGNILGTSGVARTSDPGVTLTVITATGAITRFGAAIAAHDAGARADIDGDGREDLLIAGLAGSAGAGLVWFGGSIPTGAATTATVPYAIPAPGALRFGRQFPQGFAGQARWIGDINRDGLDDVAWASPFDNGGDGSFEVLWDAR
jgi:hypothetical protein